MRKIPGWVWLFIAPVLLVVIGVPSLWVYMSYTAEALHPVAGNVPATMAEAPAGQWAGAVERARKAVRASVAEQNLPGLSVAVGVDGELVWAEGFGFADLEESLPVTPRHRFRIGTASAVLTSAGAGLLIEEGRLKLEDEIQAYVPAFPKKQWPVTVREVMGHMAGVAADGGDEGPLFSQHCERPEEAVQYFAEQELRFRPGSEFRESNYGWILMSAAMEEAARQGFLEFMRARVFEPLGMRDTVADQERMTPDEDFPLVNLVRELIHDPEATREVKAPVQAAPVAGDQVKAYFPRFGADPKYGLHSMRPLDYSCYAGASVFVSTPSDLVRFGMAVQGGKLLKRETVEMLQASQRLGSGAETGYGLGWDSETMTLAGKAVRVVGHDGDALGGRVASLMTFPEQGMVVAVLTNISYADTAAIGLRVAEEFVGR